MAHNVAEAATILELMKILSDMYDKTPDKQQVISHETVVQFKYGRRYFSDNTHQRVPHDRFLVNIHQN